MSFKTSKHLKQFEPYLNRLLPGDIVFTTEDHVLSGAIRFLANLPISHCNLYSKPMHLIESSGTVTERYIPKFFEENNFIRTIAYQNPLLSTHQRKEIIASAESYKGRGYDAMQLLAHGVTSLGNSFLQNATVNLGPSIIMNSHPAVPLATKRMVARGISPILDLIAGQDNAPKSLGRPREVLMCSTLIAYSYMDAGIDLKLTNPGFVGTDDLFYFCRNNMKMVFDFSFDENGLTFNTR